LRIPNKSSGPPPLSSSSSPSTCAALFLFCCRRRALPLAVALPPSPLHLLLPLLHASPLPNPGPVSLFAAFSRARHGVPSRPPAATSSPPRSVPMPTSSSLLFCSTETRDHRDIVCISSPFAVHTPSSNYHHRSLLPSGEPLATVGSRHRPPIASTNSSASFPDLYLCSPAPSRLPISIGAPSPTTIVRRRLLLTVGSSL
jgi:hypothetical protein